jgi:hypothetical protein
VPPLAGELQVIGRPPAAEHHAVEAVVVAELGQQLEAQPAPLEPDHRRQVVAWACHPQVGLAHRSYFPHRCDPPLAPAAVRNRAAAPTSL